MDRSKTIWSTKKYDELRPALKERGLVQKGRKDELIQRLIEHDNLRQPVRRSTATALSDSHHPAAYGSNCPDPKFDNRVTRSRSVFVTDNVPRSSAARDSTRVYSSPSFNSNNASGSRTTDNITEDITSSDFATNYGPTSSRSHGVSRSTPDHPQHVDTASYAMGPSEAELADICRRNYSSFQKREGKRGRVLATFANLEEDLNKERGEIMRKFEIEFANLKIDKQKELDAYDSKEPDEKAFMEAYQKLKALRAERGLDTDPHDFHHSPTRPDHTLQVPTDGLTAPPTSASGGITRSQNASHSTMFTPPAISRSDFLKRNVIFGTERISDKQPRMEASKSTKSYDAYDLFTTKPLPAAMIPGMERGTPYVLIKPPPTKTKEEIQKGLEVKLIHATGKQEGIVKVERIG